MKQSDDYLKAWNNKEHPLTIETPVKRLIRAYPEEFSFMRLETKC